MFSGPSASSPPWLLDPAKTKALAGGTGATTSVLGLKSCFPKTGVELVSGWAEESDQSINRSID